ncbi:MAG: DUF2079 domain-containing protein [Candidatus Eremiobacteraeota bacterium]|nr:DUF2079 domain-containing protein [Candidatus Eremiobacteraeota bacterium]
MMPRLRGVTSGGLSWSLRPTYIAVAIFAVVYIALDLNKLYALRYGADLGTYLQTLVNLRHGSSWNYGEWRPHLLVHDSWLLVALVPLIAVFPRAETLVAVQVIAVAAAAIPLAILGSELGLAPRAANAVAIAYLLTPSAQGLSYDNFSENAFVPLLVALGALAVRRRSFWAPLILAQLLLGVKEDQMFFVAWFGIACAVWWDRRMGVALVALAVCNGAGFWIAERAAGAAPNLPHYGLTIADPGGKLTMVLLLLAPFAFAPLAVRWWLLLGIPLLAEIVFMRPWNYEPSRVGSHYTASLVVAAAIAALFASRPYPRLARAMPIAALIAMVFIFNDTVVRPGRWPYIVDWNAYSRAVRIRESGRPLELARREEGTWAVAAANPNLRLDPRPDPAARSCPAYNTNAAAFFQSLARRAAPALCGGVPVAR